MEYQLLGKRTGIQVSKLAFGTGRLGLTTAGNVDRKIALETLDAFADAGGNFIDTSSAYLAGRAEKLIGEFLTGRDREQFVIASKYGRTPLANPARAASGSHRKAMVAEIEGSLRRLKTERIDLYFPHFDDGVTPIDEMLRGLDDLVRDGKILSIGLSNFPAWRAASAVVMAELRGWSPVIALQIQYNLLERAIEADYLPLADAHGLAIMAWSPLAGGRLVRKNATARTEPVIDALERIAKAAETTPTGVALAWLTHNGVLPVIGARNMTQLAENLVAGALKLGEAQIEELGRLTGHAPGYPYDLLRGQRIKLGV